jgi:Zn-finger protein
VARIKIFRDEVLPDDNEEEEELWEEDSCYWYPCHPKDDQQID